jgi:hypothetical protein
LQMEVGRRITIRAIPQKINARGCSAPEPRPKPTQRAQP